MRARTVSKRRISRAAFLKEPARWLIVARHVGPVTIVDGRGRVRAVLSVPRPR